MQRGSQHESDEIVWQPVGLPIGARGIDLRRPSDPGVLSELLNARFLDSETVERRPGHTGHGLRDGGDFSTLGWDATLTDTWVYGHGNLLDPPTDQEDLHSPVVRAGRAVFNHDGIDVVWTGDRLLVLRDSPLPALGQSALWNRTDADGPALKYGIPAYLPLQTDKAPPASVDGDYIETCLTESLRAIVVADSGTLVAHVLDRDTGVLIDRSDLSTGTPKEPRLVNSAGRIVLLFRDDDDDTLYLRHWTGVEWATAEIVANNIDAFDVAVADGGFHVFWRSNSQLFLAQYLGVIASDAAYDFGTEVVSSNPASGAVAVGVDPSGRIGMAWRSTSGLVARVLSPAAQTISGWNEVAVSPVHGPIAQGLSIVSRGLRDVNGDYPWVVHFCRTSVTGAQAVQFVRSALGDTTTRYNATLASKSFRVGDEVFVWLRAVNAGTHFLVGGVLPQVCGIADREEAIARASDNENYGIPAVCSDPRGEYLFSWIRPYNTGQSYSRGGGARIGDLDFLPTPTVARYGLSTYVSGSLVRCWDGETLGDAGFQDYPVVSTSTATTGGELSSDGTYAYRVYAVRYNARGERFQSAAVTYRMSAALGPGPNNKINLAISTLPDTNHDDVVFEVYRTEADGTTFYYEGAVANDLTAATVGFSSVTSDANLITAAADPHAAGVGALSEVEEWGPLGCSLLVGSGDRLFGAGGQVPAGIVQFSKLKESGEGAGFDDLAGFQTVDSEGGEITSLCRLNDATVVFQRSRLYLIAGSGPDNYGRDSFSLPQIVLADGATTHLGTVLTQLGVAYWGQNGPRLLTTGYAVENICEPVRPLSEAMVPTGVTQDLSRNEVVWYTASGDALLWNYDGGSRWARWNRLPVAYVGDGVLLTPTGRVLRADDDSEGDDGRGFDFTWATGYIRLEQLLAGATHLRRVGITGQHVGDHTLRFRVSYNGSPLWLEEFTWHPAEDTWLTIGEDLGDLTPAQIDAATPVDKSGSYGTHRRVKRGTCEYFKLAVSARGDGPSLVPFEMVFEVGAKPGLGRIPPNTFTRPGA